MRAEIGFGGLFEIAMSLERTPVLESWDVGGTIGKSRGRSTVPSLKTRTHSGISVTICLPLVVVEAIFFLLKLKRCQDEWLGGKHWHLLIAAPLA